MTLGLTISPTQDDIFAVLGAFIAGVLPAGVKVAQGQVNRVVEPPDVDYVLMWPLRFPRLATNLDDYIDAAFTGSIAGGTMTITAVDQTFSGQLRVGSVVFGVDVAPGTTVTALGTGTGGTGTYTVTPSQTVTSQVIAAGVAELTEKAEFVAQVDVHGPAASDNAQIIATTFRDAFACDFFAALDRNVTPLYSEDPRQTPFRNAEQQYENRLTIEARMQVNQTVSVPLQFATSLTPVVIEVDATYPP